VAHGDIALATPTRLTHGPTPRLKDPIPLMMIEQPLDYDDLVQHARLQQQLRTPICLDESIQSAAAIDALDLGRAASQHQAGPPRRGPERRRRARDRDRTQCSAVARRCSRPVSDAHNLHPPCRASRSVMSRELQHSRPI
jgi:hypothetical protein